ncbi:MAG: type IX secretion system membrane protein PorP/SprF [Bacteroidia bacterium]|nr:type IX secretion system membrane protein PorP/SprF [Bacteroidia bacterium]MCZ2248438.1 type IX secretion system membrane protein PorP/SprF [Bacteroidia bacterium]
MKKIVTSVLLVLSGIQAFAQQDPQFSQQMFTRLSTNAGFAGASEYLCATVINRQQWVGFDGAPKTTLVTIDAPFKIGEQTIGVGATIIADKLGFEKTFFAKLAGAYRLNIGPGNLGVGLDLGLLNKAISGNFISIDQGDNLIPLASVSDNTMDLGFGAHYHIPGKLYAGISGVHLLAPKLANTSLQYLMARHWYVTAGYEYDINETLKVRPNFLLKTDAASTQLDVNANVLYNNMLWAGLSYRLQDAIVPLLGYQGTLANGKGNYRIGYSYDLTLSNIKQHSSGSHEIMLGFCYNITPPKKITRYKNPRFL